MIIGASSDKDAIVKIMRELEHGYVLIAIKFCRERCPVPVHLHFAKYDEVPTVG